MENQDLRYGKFENRNTDFLSHLDQIEPHDLSAVKKHVDAQEGIGGNDKDVALFLWYLRNMSPSYFSQRDLVARDKILEQRYVYDAAQIARILEDIASSPDLLNAESLTRLSYLARIDCSKLEGNKRLHQEAVLAVQKEVGQFFQDHKTVYTGVGNITTTTVQNKEYKFRTIHLWRFLYKRGLLDRSIFFSEDEKTYAENSVSDYLLSVIKNRLSVRDVFAKDFEESEILSLKKSKQHEIYLVGSADVCDGKKVGFKLSPSVDFNRKDSQLLQLASPVQFGWYDMPQHDLRISGKIVSNPSEEVVKNCFNELTAILGELILKGMPVSFKVSPQLNDVQFENLLIYADYDTVVGIFKGMQKHGYQSSGEASLVSTDDQTFLYPFGDFLFTVRGTGEAEFNRTVVDGQLAQIRDELVLNK